jgi:hypothetical protein
MSKFTTRERIVVIALLTSACGGSGGNGVLETPVQFIPSTTQQDANVVRLAGGAIGNDEVQVDVMIGGPTTSDDLYSFAFDLIVSDPDHIEYVDASAEVGTALIPTGSQGRAVLVSRDYDRVIVGVSKTGGGDGNGVADGEESIVSLLFRVLRNGSSTIVIAGAGANPSNPSNQPSALDHVGQPIDSVEFDSAPARIVK